MSLCRICLEDGAALAIFDSEVKDGSIYNKITKCIKVKVEDVEGFPRFICEKCHSTLETVCNFIDTFTESSKILQNRLTYIKQETSILYEEYSDFDYSDVDVKIKEEIKFPFDKKLTNNGLESKIVEPLVLKIKRDGRPKQQTHRKSVPKNTTNRIGTSMLEGEFKWDGENWSLNCNKISSKKTVKNRSIKLEQKPTRYLENKEPKPKPEPSKLCDVCGEVFSDKSKLATHRRRHKEQQKNLKCPKCPKKLVSQYYLDRHLKRRHDGSKDFICSVCGAQFFFKSELTSHHKRVHEKHLGPKKIFKCKFCEKTYKCQKSVTIHERSVHTGERPAVCAVCSSTFYHEDYLREHMRLHTGETPFKCPICQRGYAQNGNMKSHLRNHRIADIEPTVLSKLRPSYFKYLKDNR